MQEETEERPSGAGGSEVVAAAGESEATGGNEMSHFPWLEQKKAWLRGMCLTPMWLLVSNRFLLLLLKLADTEAEYLAFIRMCQSVLPVFLLTSIKLLMTGGAGLQFRHLLHCNYIWLAATYLMVDSIIPCLRPPFQIQDSSARGPA